MRKPLIAGNWKMNGTRTDAGALARAIQEGGAVAGVEVAVLPPFVHLPDVAAVLEGGEVRYGAQNVADQASGAYTGEVSAAMLAELGCRYALVGHSERRTHYGESDELVAKRFAAARAGGLVPILCVGETLAEREADETEAVIARQLATVADTVGGDAFADAVVAYEPVWAIGTGRTATPEQAQAVHAFVREQVAQLDASHGERLRILYGGSMKPANAAALVAMEDVDGGLIGGASLVPDDFLSICRAAG